MLTAEVQYTDRGGRSGYVEVQFPDGGLPRPGDSILLNRDSHRVAHVEFRLTWQTDDATAPMYAVPVLRTTFIGERPHPSAL